MCIVNLSTLIKGGRLKWLSFLPWKVRSRMLITYQANQNYYKRDEYGFI